MPKFYVKCGQIKFIIDCTHHDCAILSALTHFKNKKVMFGKKICVSEKGFDDFKSWTCYNIEDYIRKI